MGRWWCRAMRMGSVLGVAFGLRLSGLGERRPPLVALGPGANEVKLCVAKLAAKVGCDTWVVVNDVQRSQMLMYGKNDKGPARPISEVDDIAEALAKCEAVVVCCDLTSGPPSARAIRGIFSTAQRLKHVSMLSSIGGGKASWPFGKSLDSGEMLIRDSCQKRNVQFSLVRSGALKGGGPGEVATSGPRAGQALTDHGLSKAYYDTIFDLAQAQTTMAYDRFTIGANVVAGDPYTPPNLLISAATAADFKPRKTDANRVAVAGALVAAVRRSKGGEFTVSAAAAKNPPSAEEWLTLLDRASTEA